MQSVIDLIIRIKNGYMAGNMEVSVPATKVKLEVLKKLVSTGYISSFDVVEDGHKKVATLKLKYDNKRPAMMDVKIMSKPGKRVYVPASEIPKVVNGIGICVLSTNTGILTGNEAKKANVGGELLFNIW